MAMTFGMLFTDVSLGLRQLLEGALSRLKFPAQGRANPTALATFRIVFAASGLVYAIGALPYHNFRWYGHDSVVIDIAWWCHVIWIASLFLLLAGLGGRAGRLVQVVHYLAAAATIFYPGTLGHSAQEALYIIPSFWLVFMRVDDVLSVGQLRNVRPPTPPASWPVFLLALNLGLVFLGAGVSKAVDPLWRSGLGFYYAFHLPWIKLPHTEGLVQHGWLMYSLNYFVMLLELAVLPLFLFGRTRCLSIALSATFFLGLIYPMRLDFIGWTGLAATVALLSVLPRTVPPKYAQPRPHPNARLRCAVICVAAAAMVLLQARASAARFVRLGQWESRFGVPQVLRGALRILNHSSIWAVEWTLFTKEHTQGIYLYRVQIQTSDGDLEEPLRVFLPDKRPGPLSAHAVPRFLQASIYPLSDFCLVRSFRLGHPPSDEQRRVMQALIRHATAASTRTGATVEAARLLVSPIIMPVAFEGNTRPWESAPWISVYEYRAAQDSFRLTEARLPKFPRQGRVQGLPNSF